MKAQIVEELGETALALPGLIAAALKANDRAKYYMSLLQACREHAAHADRPAADLRAEREASGEDDTSLDQVVGGTQSTADGSLVVPQAPQIHQRLFRSIEQMLAPFRVTAADLSIPVEAYERRLTALRDRQPAVIDGAVPAGYVDAVTRADRGGPDSVHLLVMDLHRELNGLQSRMSERSLDGAAVYGVSDEDDGLIRAFMRGVNSTAPLKFDHPGLGTTATRAGNRLVIQNDIGTTDAHVLVVHVEGLSLSFVYTDVHLSRLRFFKSLFDRAGIEWTERGTGAGDPYATLLGRRSCAHVGDLNELLTLLGSRLVFLIDWNRARKRLSRFVKKSDAIAVLRWAADRGFGHRAFLEAGGERLIYNAFERVAQSQLRSGARLDDVLGRDGALTFLQAVLRITSEGLQHNRSLRLLRDEVQAELLGHLHDSQQGVLTLASDHAALVVALALAVRDGLDRLRSQPDVTDLSAAVERAKQWETNADDIVRHARHAQREGPDAEAVGRLVPSADDVADGLEEAMFLLALLQAHMPSRGAIDALARLATVCVAGAQEYVKCLEIAQDVRRNGTREDVQEFLVAVDRIITLEHESDQAERSATAAVLMSSDDFRSLHLVSLIAHALEESVDALARCALMLKDWVMSEMLVV